MVFHDVPRDDHEEENKEDYDVPNNDDIDEGKISLWKYCVFQFQLFSNIRLLLFQNVIFVAFLMYLF